MMANFFHHLSTRLTEKPQAPVRPLPLPEPEPDEMTVPEITVADLQQALPSPQPPLRLDVRELWEWQQVQLPAACHMPMNEVPPRLMELPQARAVVVICAHGSRSYGVAGYLIEQAIRHINSSGGDASAPVYRPPVCLSPVKRVAQRDAPNVVAQP